MEKKWGALKTRNSLHPIFKNKQTPLCFSVVSILSPLYHPKVALKKKTTSPLASPLNFPPNSNYRLSSPTCWAALLYRCRLFRRRLGAGNCWTRLRRWSSRNCACFSDSELRGDGTTCGPQKRPDPIRHRTLHTQKRGSYQVASAEGIEIVLWQVLKTLRVTFDNIVKISKGFLDY